MIWYFDIDGTLCDTDKTDYVNAIPDNAIITLVNMLYDRGDTINLITARGQTSGIYQRSLTEKQLKGWGVKYHTLEFALIVSDYVTSPMEFLEIIE